MSYSFEIKTSKELFMELVNLHEAYEKDIMSSGKAISCAIFAWHIVEWIYKEFPEITSIHNTKTNFQTALKNQCHSLKYIQDIANGSKHNGINMYTPTVKNTSSHSGAFSESFSPKAFSRKAFNISGLQMELSDGTKVFFDEEIIKVRNFFHSYFTNTLGVNV